MRIEPLRSADAPEVEAMLDAAFGADRRTRTAYRLRAGSAPIAGLSLAARDETGALAGSLQCWPIVLLTPAGTVHPLVLLGAVAVASQRQGEGIGSALMRACLARAGTAPMLLIGDAPYYARFDFSAARTAHWLLPGPVDRARLLARSVDAIPAVGTVAPAWQRRKAA